MKKLFFALLLTLLASIGYGQSQSSGNGFNFGLENSVNGKMPDNWKKWGNANYYNIGIDSVVRHSGKNSVVIYPMQIVPNAFGCLASTIPASYEGKMIELRAYIKMENINDAPIGLMLRIDGASESIAFDNMQDKGIKGTADWTQYSVKLPYPEKAKYIHIGVILQGSGKLWADDFEVLIDGKDIEEFKTKEIVTAKAEKDTEFDNGSGIYNKLLSDKKIDDIKAVGLIWGFLKYHHPNIAKGDFNWDYELFRILPKVVQSKKQNERDSILLSWIESLGDYKTDIKEISDTEKIKIYPDLNWITKSKFSPELEAMLLKVKNAKRSDEHYYIGFDGNIGNPVFKHENGYTAMQYTDAGFRLLSLFRYWNIIQYYFPYKNLIEEDWNDVLTEFIPDFVNASDELQYKLAVLELIARVNDTHANIWGTDNSLRKYIGVNYSPVAVKFIEGQLVVTDFYNEVLGKETGLQKGDIIAKINKEPVSKIASKKSKYAPASNIPTKLRILADQLLRSNDSTINITIKRDGTFTDKVLKTYSSSKINFSEYWQKNDSCFRYINTDIAYLNPGRIKNSYLPDIMKEVLKTKGLIIDFRSYPSEFIVFTLSEYLLPNSTEFVRFSNGSIQNPGLFTFNKTLSVGRKNDNFYKGKVVILVNETTQSSAEYHTMAFRTAPGAKVIGSTTAGADGNISRFVLPGGISTAISGIGIYYPDGRETQRVGIVPDIVVKPTIKGIKENRDELIEKAIEVINCQLF
ncbi:MAG: hypothetical protein A2X18_13655 [Bacteroidetes bacterium GWF2_40_14]|nr:MAG: hypothetical protein A2X18_13655 [Bacteroidetes bacterium GWF2_40_14]